MTIEPEASPAGAHQGILVAQVQVGGQGDLGDFGFARFRTEVQRFNVIEMGGDRRARNQAMHQGMKGERIVRTGREGEVQSGGHADSRLSCASRNARAHFCI